MRSQIRECQAKTVYAGSVTPWVRILVQVTIYRRLRISRDGHLDQSEAYDIVTRP